MANKTAVFFSSAIPVHNGDPGSRLAYLQYRTLELAHEHVQLVVLDLTGQEFAKRARAPSGTRFVPIRHLDATGTPSGQKAYDPRCLSRLKQIVLELDRGGELASFYVSDAKVESALGAAGLTDGARPTRFAARASADPIARPYRDMIQAVYGIRRSQEQDIVCLMSSGNAETDAKLMLAASETLEEINRLFDTNLECRVFGAGPATVAGSHDRVSHAPWADMTGVLARACLLVNALPDERDFSYVQAEAEGFCVDTLIPAHMKDRSGSSNPDLIHVFASGSGLLSLLRQILIKKVQYPSDPAIPAPCSFPNITKACLDHVGLKVKKSRLPDTPESFLFDRVGPVRTSPLVLPPLVYSVPATGLVNVQAIVRHSSGVNEIRVLDMAGAEIGRVVPSRLRPKLSHQPIDGGFILHDGELPSPLRLSFHASGRFCWEEILPAETIKIIRSELASVTFVPDEPDRITGTIWTDTPYSDLSLHQPLGFQSRLGAPRSSTTTSFVNWIEFDLTGPIYRDYGRSLELGAPAHNRGYHREFRLGRCFSRPAGAQEAGLGALRGKHAGRRAWIIGNGPSVSLEDLDRIASQNEPVFCFNRFYMAHGNTDLRETYLVSADTLMIADFGQEMIDKSGGLPVFCAEPAELPALEGDYLQVSKIDTSMPVFSTEADRYVHVGGSSVFVAMQLAYLFGIRELVTYGMDYSFNQTPVFDPRYPMPVCFDEGNHFIQGYRSEKPWCPPNWRDISFGFLKARTVFDSQGGRILNATRGGKLEIFERAVLEDLLR